MAKLPAEMHEVPVKMLPPTGENAKGTGENGGRTSEEPLSEPHTEPLKKEAPPSSSFEKSSVVVAGEESKVSGEQSEPRKIVVSEHLARLCEGAVGAMTAGVCSARRPGNRAARITRNRKTTH